MPRGIGHFTIECDGTYNASQCGIAYQYAQSCKYNDAAAYEKKVVYGKGHAEDENLAVDGPGDGYGMVANTPYKLAQFPENENQAEGEDVLVEHFFGIDAPKKCHLDNTAYHGGQNRRHKQSDPESAFACHA